MPQISSTVLRWNALILDIQAWAGPRYLTSLVLSNRTGRWPSGGVRVQERDGHTGAQRVGSGAVGKGSVFIQYIIWTN